MDSDISDPLSLDFRLDDEVRTPSPVTIEEAHPEVTNKTAVSKIIIVFILLSIRTQQYIE